MTEGAVAFRPLKEMGKVFGLQPRMSKGPGVKPFSAAR